MTYKQTHKWVDALEQMTYSYNHTYHRSIKQTPASIGVKDELHQWKLQYDSLPKAPKARGSQTPYIKYRFKVGDEVRISFLRRAFQKQHDERWRRETFTIIGRSLENGIPQYILQDYSEEKIQSKFYQNQLAKAYPPESFLVESVLK